MKNILFVIFSFVLLAAGLSSCRDGVAVTEVRLSESVVTLKVGDTKTLTATVLPEDAADKTVKWSSSNDNVATVKEGLITAAATGTATITATVEGKSATCAVTVSEADIAVSEVTLDQEAVMLGIGKSVKLNATVKPDDATDKTVTWDSSNGDVAIVDQDGNVLARTEGTATITATAGDKKAYCEVTVVYIPVSGVTLEEETLTLEVGSVKTLAVTVLPEDATDKTVTWESSNHNIVTIIDGKVIAAGEGSDVTITVTAGGDKTATCKVSTTQLGNDRWARSNIVWIEDGGKPEGGYLTFAVTPDDNAAIPANVQGVFFQWGSLVAVSPVGVSYNMDQILFSSTGNTSYTWENIPSLNDVTTPPFADPEDTEDDFASYNKGMGFDAATGMGDICRYISAQGWVEGNWRMPTGGEITTLINPARGGGSVIWTGSTWMDAISAPADDNNANGFYQPVSGYFLGAGVDADDNKTNPAKGYAFGSAGMRDYSTGGTAKGTGLYGFHWVGSSYNASGTTAYDLEVYYYTSRKFNANCKNGLPIRCIRMND